MIPAGYRRQGRAVSTVSGPVGTGGHGLASRLRCKPRKPVASVQGAETSNRQVPWFLALGPWVPLCPKVLASPVVVVVPLVLARVAGTLPICGAFPLWGLLCDIDSTSPSVTCTARQSACTTRAGVLCTPPTLAWSYMCSWCSSSRHAVSLCKPLHLQPSRSTCAPCSRQSGEAAAVEQKHVMLSHQSCSLAAWPGIQRVLPWS